MQLQKADNHENQTVRANAARPHLIKIALDKKLLEDHDKRPETRKLDEILLDKLGRFHAIGRIEADVDFGVGFYLEDFYNRHWGFVQNFNVLGIADILSDERIF